MKNVWEAWSSALCDTECDTIIERSGTYSDEDATVGFSNALRSDLAYRTSSIRWLSTHQEGAIVERVMQPVGASKRNDFHVDIMVLHELQFTEYHATNSGHYDWHHDVWFKSARSYARKLSVIAQLSLPAEYQGGVLEFFGVENPAVQFAPRGSVLIFPSFLQHRVLPVTKGTRRSLVTWVEGPNWR